LSEPIIEQKPDEVEVITLRRINAELLAAKHTLKARVAVLESEAATATMRAAVITLPMQRLAEIASNAPELFLEQLSRDYDVVANDDGSLALNTKDGKLVTARDSKPLEMTHNGLYNLLAGMPHEKKDNRARLYTTIMKFSGSSGGMGRPMTPSAKIKELAEKEIVPTQFGLR
jgi:hypothetical protein